MILESCLIMNGKTRHVSREETGHPLTITVRCMLGGMHVDFLFWFLNNVHYSKMDKGID